MEEKKPWETYAASEVEQTEEIKPWEQYADESSPKSTAPSKTGGESGASVSPMTSTSTSSESSLGSWTAEANPYQNKGVQVPLAKPIDGVEQTKIVQPKLKAAELGKGLDLFQQQANQLNEEYKANPTPELEEQMKQMAINYKDTKDAYAKALFEEKHLGGSIGKKKVEDESIASDLYNSFKAGSEALGAGLANTPSFLYDVFALPQNLIAKYTGLNVGTSADKVAEQYNIPKNKVAEFYTEAAKETKAKIDEKYDNSITGYIADGEYGKATKMVANGVMESLPVTLSLMAGNWGGVTPLASTIGGGVVFGAEKKQQLNEENPTLDEVTKTTNSLSTGLFEGIFENFGLTKLGGIAKEVFAKQGKEAAQDIAKQSFREVYAPLVKKYVGVGSADVLSEMETQFATNVVDKYSGVKPDLDLRDGVIEAGLISLGQVGGMTTPVAAVDVFTTKQARAKAKENAAKIQSIEADIANPLVSDEVKETLSNEIGVINTEMADLKEAENELVKNVPIEKREAVAQNWRKIDALEESLPNLSEEAKKAVEAKIVELENENNLILATPEAEAGVTLNTETDGKERREEEAQINVLTPTEEVKGAVEAAPLVITPNLPTIDIKTPNPFNKELEKLGYEQSDIDKMTMEQKQEIVINKTEAPVVESSAKVDSTKENAKQEKIAAAQAQLDQEIKAENESNIQQQVDKGSSNDGAVGDIAKENEAVEKVTPVNQNGKTIIDENGDLTSELSDQFEQLKKDNDLAGMDKLYSTVKIFLNGVAQSKGEKTVKQFKEFKKTIEDYAKEIKPTPNETKNTAITADDVQLQPTNVDSEVAKDDTKGEVKAVAQTVKAVDNKIVELKTKAAEKDLKKQKEQLTTDLNAIEDILLGKAVERKNEILNDKSISKQDKRNALAQLLSNNGQTLNEVSEVLKKEGFKVANGKVKIQIYNDGELNVSSIRDAIERVEDDFNTSMAAPTIRKESMSGRPNAVGNYSTKSSSKKSLQDAIDNLETAKAAKNKGLIDTYEKQLKLEKQKYDEVNQTAKSNERRLSEVQERIKSGKLEDRYDLKEVRTINDLKSEVDKFNESEAAPIDVDLENLKSVAETLIKKEEAALKEYIKPHLKKDGNLKVGLNNNTKGSIDRYNRNIDELKEELGIINEEISKAKTKSESAAKSTKVENKVETDSNKQGEIPQSKDGLYQIYTVKVKDKNTGGIKQMYGVPSYENRESKGFGDSLHDSLEDAIAQIDENKKEGEIFEAKKEQERIYEEKKAADDEIRKEKNKGKTALEIANEAKEEKALDVKVRIDGKEITKRERLENAIKNGGNVAISEKDGKVEYRLFTDESSFYTINKSEYKYGKQLEEVAPKEEVNKPKSAKEVAKENLDKAREAFRKAQGKIQSGGLGALPEFINLVKAAIEYGYVSSKEFLKEFRNDIDTKYSDSEVEAAFDNIVNPPSGEKPKKKKKKRKSLLNRAFKGTSDETVKKAIEKYGLFYETENQVQAQKDAKDFVREVGDEAALDAVRKNLVEGGRAAFIFAQVIDNVMIDMANAKNIQEAESLLAIQGELLDEFDRRARAGGQFNAALNLVYQTADFNYSLERQIKKYKDMNNGVIPKEVEAKMNELEAQLKEVNEQLKAAEERAKEAEEKAAIENIKEDVNRGKDKETYSQKAKKTADKFRAKFKTKPKFYDENGNEIEVFTAGFTWNDLVELAAKAIEKTGNIADGLKAVSEFVQESDVYKKLTKKGQAALDKQIGDYFSEDKTQGRVKVPHSLIRRLVEEGNTDMDSLVAAVKKEIAEEYPDATDREIRDAITGYGKTVNQNQEEIEKQIRKLKFLGRAQSALEDIAMKKRPLKSGAQRDKLDADERKLLKEIKQAMKDLPVDLETQEAQLKTALDAAKTRLTNRIEDLTREIETGELAKKNNKPMITDQEYDDLVAERDRLKEIHQETFKRGGMLMEEKIANTIKALDKAIEETERKIAENDLAFKAATKLSTPEIEAKREQLNKSKELLKQLRQEAGIIEARRLENAKNSVKKRIAELERRIREKDFSKKKPTPLIKDNELIKLNAQKLRIKGEFDKLQYQNELNNRNKVQKFYDGALEVWGLPRALLATGEFSFMLIQGGIYTLGNWRLARSSFYTAMKALWNENRAKQQLKQLQAQDFYPIMKASKLALTEPDAKLEAREEQFLGGWVNYIWDVAGYPSKIGGEKLYEGWKKANPIRAVERAGVSYLNMLRVQKFLEGQEMLLAQGKTFETHPQDYKNLADVINTFTGRASLGKGEQFSKELSAVFFSPRNWASMIKQASPYAIYHIGKMGSREEGQSSLSLLMQGKVKPSVAQKMAIKDFLKYSAITAGFVVMAAIKYNNDDDEETEVSTDPTSSDFLKIKLGNTRIDPWGGKIQQVILTNRIIASLTGGDGKALDYSKKMIVNKFNPSASMAYKYLNAKKDAEGLSYIDQYGNPISMKEDLWNSIRPIYWQSFAEINKENPTARAGLLHLYGFLGGGTQTYSTPTEIMKSKNVSYEDLENVDVVTFKDKVSKSADEFAQSDIDELTVTYAKEIKDLNRQVEKGLIKETKTQKALIEAAVIKKYKEDLKTVTSEEKLEKALGELKTTAEKANKLKTEFAKYNEGQKKWVAVKSISAQENKIKKLVKKGIIDNAVEKEVYRLMADINAENKK